jgi:hypothetical protein
MAKYVLHHGVIGFLLFMYGLLASVTLPIAISCLALEMKDWNAANSDGFLTASDLTQLVTVPSVQPQSPLASTY